jgi:two-component system response regulator YesN
MYRVLLVDDEFYVRAMLRRIISWEELEFEIVGEAENGEEALEKVEECVPDLVIADIEMPFIDGLELARRLNKTRPSLKILFLTCYDRFEYARKAIQYGVDDYLLKPILPDELTNALNSIREKLDAWKRDMNQSVASISALSVLRETFLKRLHARNCEGIGQFLADTSRSVEKKDLLCSREAIQKILLDALEEYCQETGVSFEKPESADFDDLARLALEKACGCGGGTARQDELVRSVQNYIASHLSDPGLSLSSIAQGVYMNPSYLSRVYNQATGECISTYIRDARLSRGLKLIENGAANVERVAEEVGFRNAGYFSRCFKDRYGVSPTDIMLRRTEK